jgi:hypothetical protein
MGFSSQRITVGRTGLDFAALVIFGLMAGARIGRTLETQCFLPKTRVTRVDGPLAVTALMGRA